MKLTFHDWLLILVGAGVVALKIGSMLCGEWCL